jgi:anti-anti-sigma factor
MLATVKIDRGGVAPVARIAGEIDASNASGLTEQLKDAVPNTSMGLVLDLSETTYIDSSGVHLLFDLSDALRRRQQTLQLVVGSDTFVADVLAAVNLASATRGGPTLGAALQAVERDHL